MNEINVIIMNRDRGQSYKTFFGVYYVTIGTISIKIFRKYVDGGKTYAKKVL